MKIKWDNKHVKAITVFIFVFALFTGVHISLWQQHYAFESNTDTEALIRAYEHLFKFNQWP